MKAILLSALVLVAGTLVVSAQQVRVASMPNLTSLPLGSREVLSAQVEKECTKFFVGVSLPNTEDYYLGHQFPYDVSQGPLCDAIKRAMVEVIDYNLRSTDPRTNAEIAFLIVGANVALNSPFYTDKRLESFPLVWDSQGKFVPSPELGKTLTRWPLVKWVPVSNVLTNVEQVEYILRDPKRPLTQPPNKSRNSANGMDPGSVIHESTKTNGHLYLDLDFIDPDMIRSNGWGGVVRFYYHWDIYNPYSKTFEDYDVLTGQKVRSTFTTLEIKLVNGQPQVIISGFPGTKVALETTPDLKVWTERAQITLDEDGTGTYPLPSYEPTRPEPLPAEFFRTRYLIPGL